MIELMTSAPPAIQIACSLKTDGDIEAFIHEQGGAKYLSKVYRRNPVGAHGDFQVVLTTTAAALAFLKLLLAYVKTRRCLLKVKKDGVQIQITAPSANDVKDLLKSKELQLLIREKPKPKPPKKRRRQV